jgi:hypothetical protein
MHHFMIRTIAVVTIASGGMALMPSLGSSQVDPLRDCKDKPYVCSGPNGTCCGKHGCYSTNEGGGGCEAW